MRKLFEITVLGTSSATPTKYRHPSAQYVRLEGSYLLLDCGEGAQRQLSRYGLRVLKISHVFITHLRKYLKNDSSIKIENIHNRGFILRIGDKQYNASVANRLQVLKRELSN